MAEDWYKEIDVTEEDEGRFRDLWNAAYVKQRIVTVDGIRVHFYDDNFDHAFYESSARNRSANKKKKKDVLSLVRLSRFYWIKDVLRDPEAELYVGYDSATRSYSDTKRVSVVKEDYVVVIDVYSETEAKFITAYKAENSIEKIKSGPKWKLNMKAEGTKKDAD